MTYEVVDVSDWSVVSQEPGGAEQKDWVVAPGEADRPGRKHLWLYKAVKRGTQSGYRRHDDSAERLASVLAGELGLPAADVRLARRDDGEGIISRNVTPDGWEMHSGDTVLSECPGYVSCSGDERLKDRVGHNLTNIAAVLQHAGGPPDGPCDDWPAFDVFAGYLVFDAWIANTDRHAINWAVLEREDQRRLAPSFDHGSALASGIADEHLSGRDPVGFAGRGRATRFEGGADLTLVDVAFEAIDRGGPLARRWLDRVTGFDPGRLDGLLRAAVMLSDQRRTFLGEVLKENQRRLGA